jgi:hypothetical protein
MIGPDPSDLQRKKESLILMGIVPGAFLGLCGALIESSMKEPFKLAFGLCGFVRTQIPEFYGQAFSTLWLGITNLKLYYILVGLLLLLFWSSVSLLFIGVVIGAFLGGAIYWFLSAAQP